METWGTADAQIMSKTLSAGQRVRQDPWGERGRQYFESGSFFRLGSFLRPFPLQRCWLTGRVTVVPFAIDQCLGFTWVLLPQGGTISILFHESLPDWSIFLRKCACYFHRNCCHFVKSQQLLVLNQKQLLNLNQSHLFIWSHSKPDTSRNSGRLDYVIFCHVGTLKLDIAMLVLIYCPLSPDKGVEFLGKIALCLKT